MPRSKKAVMLELPEELLRSYRENCPCRGDQYGSPEPCATCKVQQEALRQLAKMRNRLAVYDAATKQQEKETKRRKQEMEAIQQAVQTKEKEASMNNMLDKVNKSKYRGSGKTIYDTYIDNDSYIDKNYSSDYEKYLKMEHLKSR